MNDLVKFILPKHLRLELYYYGGKIQSFVDYIIVMYLQRWTHL